METLNITNTTTSGWLICKTLIKDNKKKVLSLESKEIIKLDSLKDKELEEGLESGEWKFEIK